MSNLIPGNHKHISLDDRTFIEQSLDSGKSFREIARYPCKALSTISKEVWKHLIVNTWNKGSFNNSYNFCIYCFRCKKTTLAANWSFVIPSVVPATAAITSAHVLSGNTAGRFKRLPMSAMAATNSGTDAWSRQNLITMQKPSRESTKKSFKSVPVRGKPVRQRIP